MEFLRVGANVEINRSVHHVSKTVFYDLFNDLDLFLNMSGCCWFDRRRQHVVNALQLLEFYVVFVNDLK